MGGLVGRLIGWAKSPQGALTLVAAITVFGFGLRIWHLDTEPLHVDEIRQVTQVQAPWGEIVELSYGAQQPPLDYLIGKAVVTLLPATDIVQRLPSALFGTASILLAGLVLIRQRQSLAGVFAAFFMAISPLLVELSQYARPYALPIFMAIATIAVYQHWQLGSRNRTTFVLFTLVAALTLLSRAVMPMIALGGLGFVALTKGLAATPITRPLRLLRSDPLGLLVLPATFLIVWVPSSLKLASSTDPLSDCFSCDKWGRLASAVENFGNFGERALRPTSLALLLVTSAFVLIFPRVRAALADTAIVWLPLLITAPVFALVQAIVLPQGTFFAYRYVAFLPVGLAVFLAVGVGALISSIPSSWVSVRRVVIVVTLAVAGLMAADMLATLKNQAQTQDLADWRSTAEYIESIEDSGDLIVSIDTRPLSRESKFGFMAAPRYYDGGSTYVNPQRTIDHPERAAEATRYHFVLFVPKMVTGWVVPDGWQHAEFSEMMVLTTGALESDEERMNAWWVLTSQLRPDVAIHTQIAAAAIEQFAGTSFHPWAEVALAEAEAIGQGEYAMELLVAAKGD